MSFEVNFYQYDEELIKSLAPLLIKILDEKKNAIIFCGDEKKMAAIDASLWSYGRNKFIPHVLTSDKGFDMTRQPAIITNCEENPNNSQHLILTDEVSVKYAKSFARSFFFFDHEVFAMAKKYATNLKENGGKISLYKKSEGKWIKADF